MKFKLLVIVIAVVGELFSIGVLAWLVWINMYGFWFWFSLQSAIAWSFFIGLLNDSDFAKNTKEVINDNKYKEKFLNSSILD